MFHRILATVAVVLTVPLGACGSPPADARTLLRDAKRSVDSSQTIHFHLTSSNAESSGTYLVGGDGDARRPDGFTGELDVSINGIPLTVKVASVGGVFYVQQPFSSKWEASQPDKYGFGDPAKLIDPNTGVTSLLAKAMSPTLGNQDRYNGELLDEVNCTLPGADVARLLTSADPSRNDSAVIGVDADTHQLRRVVITGPFLSTARDSTYTLVMDRYGANITVTAPPT